jgi:ABC-2 type transport system permease protein
MSGARLVWHQFRYDQKTFWRDPAAVFFTVALPLIFLFIFVTIFGNEVVRTEGHGEIKGSTYYVPGIVTLGLISATFVNLAISLTGARERGLLKRLRKTPLPVWVFMAGRIATSIVVTLLLTIVLVVLGRLVYGVALPGSTLPGALLAVVVGAAAFCALGFALSGVIPSENAAPPITNAIILPLYFLSGVFIPEQELPGFMRSIAEAFPVKHLYEALLTAFDPTQTGAGIDAISVAAVAVWGLAGALVALRTFHWFPRSTS